MINNDFVSSSGDHEVGAEKWNEGKHKGKKPHERDHTPNPKKFEFKVLYDTQEDKVYRLKFSIKYPGAGAGGLRFTLHKLEDEPG